MDQKRTGKFIAEMRKEKGFTQAELAEKLFISDKTVSKWETGKGLPEVSLMLPLCEILCITVNELLSGTKLSPAEYQKKAEVNIVKLVKEREEQKFRLLVECIVLFLTLLSAITIMLLVGYVSLSLAWRITLTVIALVIMAVGITVCAMLEMRRAIFECPNCGNRFIPTKKAFLFGVHTVTRRRLTCPKCGERNWCKRCFDFDQEEKAE